MSNREAGTVAQQLIEGRKYLSDKKHWCRHTYKQGLFVKQYCALGYMRDFGSHEGMRLLHSASMELYGVHNIVGVNDDSRYGHKAVLRCFDRAIELALNKQV